MAGMSEKELKSVLDKIIEQIKTMLPPGVNKQNIIDNVAKHLKENNVQLDSRDFDFKNNPDHAKTMTKSLILAVCTEATHEHNKVNPNPSYNPKMKFDYSLLFDKPENNLSAFKDKLKNELKNILKVMNQPTPGNKKHLDDEQLELLADKIAAKIMDKFKPALKAGKSMSASEEAINDLSPAVTAIASMYGIDPGNPGKQQIVIQNVHQNFQGFIDYSQGGGDSQMSRQNTAEPGKTDYSGSEAFALNNAMSKGGFMQELESAITQVMTPAEPEYKSPTPFNTTPNHH